MEDVLLSNLCPPLFDNLYFFIAKSLSRHVFVSFRFHEGDPEDPVTYSTMMCACGSTWPIALDLLQMLQRQRRGFFGDILTGLLLQLQIQILWMVELLGVCHHEVSFVEGFWG